MRITEMRKAIVDTRRATEKRGATGKGGGTETREVAEMRVIEGKIEVEENIGVTETTEIAGKIGVIGKIEVTRKMQVVRRIGATDTTDEAILSRGIAVGARIDMGKHIVKGVKSVSKVTEDNWKAAETSIPRDLMGIAREVLKYHVGEQYFVAYL